MLSHIVERYLADSRELVASIEHAIEQGDADELARAAHAWRSYNGNVGAHGLASLCRELEDRARNGEGRHRPRAARRAACVCMRACAKSCNSRCGDQREHGESREFES